MQSDRSGPELTDSPDGLIENSLKALLRQRRALEVLHGANVLRHLDTLRVGDRSHATGEPSG